MAPCAPARGLLAHLLHVSCNDVPLLAQSHDVSWALSARSGDQTSSLFENWGHGSIEMSRAGSESESLSEFARSEVRSRNDSGAEREWTGISDSCEPDSDSTVEGSHSVFTPFGLGTQSVYEGDEDTWREAGGARGFEGEGRLPRMSMGSSIGSDMDVIHEMHERERGREQADP